MLLKRVGFVWKMIPQWLRLRLIRATQQKFTVSAAAIVTNTEGKVLLLNHVLRPFSGWGLPGGFMSAGEQPENTVRRELREETGIELESVKMFRVRTIRGHVEILFVAKAVGDAEIRSREILDLGWFGVDKMPEGTSRTQQSVIREALSGSQNRER